MKKLVCVLLCLIMSLSLLAGCQSEKAAESGDHLVVWVSRLTGDEAEQPEEEWLINQYARKFEEENPGVTIEIVHQTEQEAMQGQLMAAYSADTAPDIVNIYSGMMVNRFKDILTDITEYVPAEDKENLIGWESVSEGLTEGNAIYGYPQSGSELGIFIYNKELIAKAGVTLEGEGAPKNAEEFKAMLHTIKDAGIQPILASDSSKLNELFIWGTGAWWTQMSGSGRVMSNSLAETSFAEDEGFLKSLQFTADLFAEGLLNEDYMESQDAWQRFLNGEGALYPCGNWNMEEAIEIMGDNMSIYCVPSFDGNADPVQIGGIGQAWCVMKNCENPELAVKFLSYLSQKEYVIEQAKKSGQAPQRKDITAAELGWDGSEAYQKLLDYCSNCVIWNDNLLQADVANEFYRMTGMVVYGQMTPEECAAEFDAIAQDAASQ